MLLLYGLMNFNLFWGKLEYLVIFVLGKVRMFSDLFHLSIDSCFFLRFIRGMNEMTDVARHTKVCASQNLVQFRRLQL